MSPIARFIRALFPVSLLMFSLSIGCKKLIEIPPPASSITTSQTFSDSADANAAVSGIYSGLINKDDAYFSNGGITIFAGMSSDELALFDQSYTPYAQFNLNTLQAKNTNLFAYLWNPAYYSLYQCNAVIEGLHASKGINTSFKNQLIGEAKFIRAFCLFYLTNLFGDVPLVTSTSWSKNSLLGGSPRVEIYTQAVQDLKDAESLLMEDYSASLGERVRVNKGAATAMLARLYLYKGEWGNSEMASNKLISNSGLYKLAGNLDNTFLSNSEESILQLKIDNQLGPSYNGIMEAYYFVPVSGNAPSYYLTNSLLNTFELGDKRKLHWVDSIEYDGKFYYIPYKYKNAGGVSGGDVTEYYTVLRLAEVYLIRAEARAHMGKFIEAISDLNILRNRAGLANLPNSLSQEESLKAIAKERQVELFAEWGHRWFDLIRTGKADLVLGKLKSTWTATAQLYPIPFNELQADPNLKQNPGYN